MSNEMRQWGVWVSSSCDRDSDDGWMCGGMVPWRGSEEDARAWANELSRMDDRARFRYEPREVCSLPTLLGTCTKPVGHSIGECADETKVKAR